MGEGGEGLGGLGGFKIIFREFQNIFQKNNFTKLKIQKNNIEKKMEIRRQPSPIPPKE